MAISLVQNQTFSGTLTSNTQAVSISSTGGNTLIVAGVTIFEVMTGITDSAGNTWHFSTSAAQNPPWQQFSTDVAAFVGWSIGANAVTSVTIATNGNGDHATYSVSEWSGITAEDTGGGTSATSDAGGDAVSASLTLAGTGELVVGAASGNNNGLNGIPSGTTALASPNLVYELGLSGSVQWTWPGRAPSQGVVTALAAFASVSGVTVAGQVAPLALAAPAGIPAVSAPGPVSPLALAALAGTPAVSGAATIAGAVAAVTLAAPAGTGVLPDGGGDDAPWHIRRRR